MLLIWALAVLACLCNAQEVPPADALTTEPPPPVSGAPIALSSELPLGAAAAASAGVTGLPIAPPSSVAPAGGADPFAEVKPTNATIGAAAEKLKEEAAAAAAGLPPKEGVSGAPIEGSTGSPIEIRPTAQDGAAPKEGEAKPALEGEAPKEGAPAAAEAPKDGAAPIAASPKPLEAPKDGAAPLEPAKEGEPKPQDPAAALPKEGEPAGAIPAKPEDPLAPAKPLNGTQLELETESPDGSNNATLPLEPKPKDGNLTAALPSEQPLAQGIPPATTANQSIPLPVKPLANNESSVDLNAPSIPKPKNESVEFIPDLLNNNSTAISSNESAANLNASSRFLLPSKIDHIRLTIIGFTGKPVHTFNLSDNQVLYQMKVFWGEPESWQDIGNKPTDRLYELFCWLTVHGGYARDLFRGNLSASLDQHSQWYAFPEAEDKEANNISVNCGLRPVNGAGKGGDWSFADPAPVREAPVFLRGFENVNVRGWTKEEVIRLIRNQKRQDQPVKSKAKSKNRRATR